MVFIKYEVRFFYDCKELGAKIIEYYFHNKEVPNSACARLGTKPKQKTLSSKVWIFIEFCPHEVPGLMACQTVENLFS